MIIKVSNKLSPSKVNAKTLVNLFRLILMRIFIYRQFSLLNRSLVFEPNPKNLSSR